MTVDNSWKNSKNVEELFWKQKEKAKRKDFINISTYNYKNIHNNFQNGNSLWISLSLLNLNFSILYNNFFSAWLNSYEKYITSDFSHLQVDCKSDKINSAYVYSTAGKEDANAVEKEN